jgi:hypothetical protein
MQFSAARVRLGRSASMIRCLRYAGASSGVRVLGLWGGGVGSYSRKVPQQALRPGFMRARLGEWPRYLCRSQPP